MVLYTFKGLSPFVLCEVYASGMDKEKKIEKKALTVKKIKMLFKKEHYKILLFDKFWAKKS